MTIITIGNIHGYSRPFIGPQFAQDTQSVDAEMTSRDVGDEIFYESSYGSLRLPKSDA